MLKKRGIDRVRPLAGGFDAWLAAGLPVEPLEPEASSDEALSKTPPGTCGAST